MRSLSINIFILLQFFALNAISQNNLQEKCETLYEKGKYQEVCQSISTVAADMEDEFLAMLKANALHKIGEFDSAVSYYHAAENLGYEEVDLYLNRGICKVSAGLFVDAEMDLWKALEMGADEAKCQYYFAVIDYMLFDNKESISHLLLATEKNSDYYEAEFLLAANYAELKKWNQAKQHFKRVLEIEPTHIETQLQLARVELELMQYNEALEMLEKMDEDPELDKAVLYFYTAEAHFATKNKEKACEFWEKSAEMGDGDARKNFQNICENKGSKLKKKKGNFAQF